MKVLLIYEMIPETTRLYILDVSPEDWSWLQLCHGHYINTVDLGKAKFKKNKAACDKLSARLESDESFIEPESGKPLTGDYVNGIEAIVQTGFIL